MTIKKLQSELKYSNHLLIFSIVYKTDKLVAVKNFMSFEDLCNPHA